ncbi:MAG: ATP synthase subunit I [Deltaproteobacteria bacterium]|nr:ATP synthase subunit I [Deltaproteobacteria bacterium]
MKQIRQLQKKYCSRAIIIAIIAGFCFILAGYRPLGKGLVFGALFSIFNFILMGETLPMRINKTRNMTLLLALGSIFFRYGLMAIPLVLAIKLDQFNLFATIAGLFLVQAVILGDHLQHLLIPARENQP